VPSLLTRTPPKKRNAAREGVQLRSGPSFSRELAAKNESVTAAGVPRRCSRAAVPVLSLRA